MFSRPWIGTIIGALAGYMLLDLYGLIAGVLIGSLFDRAMARKPGGYHRPSSAARRAEAAALPELLFTLMGCLAKADGRVSEEEVEYTESLIAHLNLDTQQRRIAIESFRIGARDDFQLEQFAAQRLRCLRDGKSRQTLLTLLMSLALADHQLADRELEILRHIAAHLSYSPQQFAALLRMVQAQQHFSGAPAGGEMDAALSNAYEALGVAAADSDAVIKKAYRKLMSVYHPDKLAGQDLPREIRILAKKKTQEIQNAYDTIREARAGAS